MSRCSVVSHHVFARAIEPIPNPHATAIASHASGSASDAIGIAISVELMKAP